MSAPEPSLRERAGKGIFWSIVQNWGGKIATFGLSILLARLLSPEEFGISSAAWLALLLVPLIAELGFGEAIMQRRGLQSSEVNLPFWLSVAISVLLVAGVILFREPIAGWAGLDGRVVYLVAIAATILITVPNAFQEAMYKRNMKFRALALRGLVANILGGLAAVAAAMAGLGIWSFIVQAWVAMAINVVWIWSRPEWLPGLRAEPPALVRMLRFGLPVMAQRLVDFFGTRTLDLVIIARVGLAGYGLYVVGSRFYQTLMQLLQGAFNDVSLTVLSQISHDREHLAGVYRKTISLAATALSPVFVMLAAVAPEVCHVLFGQKWVGVDGIAQALLLMGAVQCVQYMNGPFLSSRGRPELILVIGIGKNLVQILAVLLVTRPDVSGMTAVFVLASLCSTPLSFLVTSREMGLGYGSVMLLLLRPALMSAAGFAAVLLARPAVAALGLGDLWQGALLGILFALAHLALLALLDRPKARALAGVLAGLARRLLQRLGRR